MVLTFMIPFSMIFAETGGAFPQEGGPYQWVKFAYGRFYAGITSVLYWITNPIWLGGTLVLVANEAFNAYVFDLSTNSVLNWIFKLAFVWMATAERQRLSDAVSRIDAAIRLNPEIKIEVLVPDFRGRGDIALKILTATRPDVFNHNLETVPALYLKIRPGARYFHSLRLLQRVTELDPAMFTKSSIMVGLGEAREQLMQVMDDMRAADIGFISIGTHLQPTRKPAAN